MNYKRVSGYVLTGESQCYHCKVETAKRRYIFCWADVEVGQLIECEYPIILCYACMRKVHNKITRILTRIHHFKKVYHPNYGVKD